jgi:hypothetical protein
VTSLLRLAPLRLAALCLLAVIGVLAALAPAAGAAPYNIGGHRWPARTITYYDATRGVNYHKGVKLAVASWNTRGLNLHFQPASSARRANFVIQIDRSLAPNSGYATCTLTNPVNTYRGLSPGGGSDYINNYNGEHVPGSQVCYRFWGIHHDNFGTTYSAHSVDVMVTLP